MTWLTDEQIDQIIANASADDIIEAMTLYDSADQPMKLTAEIFNRSADRLGLSNGARATQMIPASAFVHWSQKIQKLLSRENPLSESTDLSPISADTGE